MEKDSIVLTDWQRILLGSTPLEFLAETLFRTIIVYALLLIATRFLGKRMSGQVSITEVAVMLTLGAIVSVPMQVAERGIIPATLILSCVVILQRSLNRWAFNNSNVDHFIHGTETILVKDQKLYLPGLHEAVISKEQLFALLRSQGVRHLGEVKRAYLEVKGGISVFKDPQSRPGLSILPPEDPDLLQAQPHPPHIYACNACGETSEQREKTCPHCGAHDWVPAVSAEE